jgi:hypothetical protein
MIVSIHQPNYLPWLGYFYKIVHSDKFVILDTVQYVKGTVANRNKIKGINGEEILLSVPVKLSEGAYQKYNEISLDYSHKWVSKHLNLIRNSYQKAPFFKEIFPEFEKILKVKYDHIAQLNIEIINWVINSLQIETKIYLASSFETDFGTSNHQNINICKYLNGSKYLSGNGAKKYNDLELFSLNGLELIYSDYKALEYSQINGVFIPNLSILDVLMNVSILEIKEMLNIN